MPRYFNTYVDVEHLMAHAGADFDEVCLADRSGELGAQVWCWTRRDGDRSKVGWLRLIVAVDNKDSATTVEHVRNVLQPRPVADPHRPLWMH